MNAKYKYVDLCPECRLQYLDAKKKYFYKGAEDVKAERS